MDTDSDADPIILKENDFERRYLQKELIGKGHFGEVYKVMEKRTGKLFAAKVRHIFLTTRS